jgi:hypothetical protein
MTRPIISIHDENGIETKREMNNEEFVQFEKDAAEAKAIEDAKIKAVEDKAILLARLGITAEEAQLLLGSN